MISLITQLASKFTSSMFTWSGTSLLWPLELRMLLQSIEMLISPLNSGHLSIPPLDPFWNPSQSLTAAILHSHDQPASHYCTNTFKCRYNSGSQSLICHNLLFIANCAKVIDICHTMEITELFRHVCILEKHMDRQVYWTCGMGYVKSTLAVWSTPKLYCIIL